MLSKTIESVLKASRGEIEVIAVLDGSWDTPEVKDDPRVTLIHHDTPIGQRAAVNEAAETARGKYILKTDGHSTFDKGFDVKLAENCKYDWTVIPRMFNLHAFDWVCENGHRFYQDKANPHKINLCTECGKRLKIEMVWKIRKHKRTDFMRFDNNLKVKYWGSYGKRPEAKGDIVDVMNGIGACWFQHRERFLELGGLDEKHGFWGQVGVEVACKAWLSGGRQVVNKKTWFAHVFRTTGQYSFPYKNPGKAQQKAEKYSRDLWLNNKWPQQKRDFQWLIDKFSPVPTWNGQSYLPTEKEVANMEFLKARDTQEAWLYIENQKAKKENNYIIDTMEVEKLWENRIAHTERRKTERFYEEYTRRHPNMDDMMCLKANPDKGVETFFATFQPFVRLVLDKGELFSIFTTTYYEYLINHLNPHDLLPELTKKGRRHIISKCKDAVNLIKSIRDNGMKDPLDMWLLKGHRILRRGFRRLVILKELGVYKCDVRVWRDEETYFKNQTDRIPKRWRKKFGR